MWWFWINNSSTAEIEKARCGIKNYSLRTLKKMMIRCSSSASGDASCSGEESMESGPAHPRSSAYDRACEESDARACLRSSAPTRNRFLGRHQPHKDTRYTPKNVVQAGLHGAGCELSTHWRRGWDASRAAIQPMGCCMLPSSLSPEEVESRIRGAAGHPEDRSCAIQRASGHKAGGAPGRCGMLD